MTTTVHKTLDDLGPSYLKGMFVSYIPERTLPSGTQDLLKVPMSNMMTLGDRANNTRLAFFCGIRFMLI